MRAAGETELAKEYPIHVVTSWLGNTPRIALKHYLQVTDADFERAARSPVQQETAQKRRSNHTECGAAGARGNRGDSHESSQPLLGTRFCDSLRVATWCYERT